MNWKIFRAILVVGACAFIAKLAATAKELAVADWFGRGDALDAFLIALLLPTTVVSLVAGSFNAALIPTYVQVRDKQGRMAAQRLFSNVQVVSLLLLIVLCILMAAGAPYYLPLLGSGFSAGKLLLTRHLLYLLLPFVITNGTLIIWAAVLNAGEKFALPALISVVTPLVTLLTLFLLGPTWGIFSLAVGMVAGSILEVFLLRSALKAQDLGMKLRWDGMTPELRLVIGQYAPMIAGSLVMGVSPIIDQSMAAMLKGGSVSALGYGYRIVNVIVTLATTGLSTAVLPYFSEMVARKDWTACRRTLKVYSSLVLSTTIPLTIGLILGSRPLVRLLYQHGAFNQADTEVVSTVQIYFSLLIPFTTWCMLFVRFLSSLRRNDLLAYGAVLNACLNVFLNIIFMRRLGVAGIALSTSAVCLFSCILLGLLVVLMLRQKEAGPCST